MRHLKADKKLGRELSHRQAMLRNMVTSLFKHEKIETTISKAKVLRPIAEKLITLAKKGDLHSRRQALSYMQDKTVAHKLFEELIKRFKEKQSGYIRIAKKGKRKGDNAPVCIMTLLAKETETPKKKKKAKPPEGKEELKPKDEEKKPKERKKTATKKTTAKKPKKDKKEK